jgi:hypothetical protein
MKTPAAAPTTPITTMDTPAAAPGERPLEGLALALGVDVGEVEGAGAGRLLVGVAEAAALEGLGLTDGGTGVGAGPTGRGSAISHAKPSSPPPGGGRVISKRCNTLQQPTGTLLTSIHHRVSITAEGKGETGVVVEGGV